MSKPLKKQNFQQSKTLRNNMTWLIIFSALLQIQPSNCQTPTTTDNTFKDPKKKLFNFFNKRKGKLFSKYLAEE